MARGPRRPCPASHRRLAVSAFPPAVHFWAPTAKWLISLANIADLYRPVEKMSVPQQVAITATGIIWSYYATQITPVNYNLLTGACALRLSYLRLALAQLRHSFLPASALAARRSERLHGRHGALAHFAHRAAQVGGRQGGAAGPVGQNSPPAAALKSNIIVSIRRVRLPHLHAARVECARGGAEAVGQPLYAVDERAVAVAGVSQAPAHGAGARVKDGGARRHAGGEQVVAGAAAPL